MVYAVFAGLWILLSDQMLSVFADISAIAYLSMIKGLTFVLVTAAFLYFALHKVPDEGSQLIFDRGPVSSSPETVLAFSETAGHKPRWAMYLFSAALTMAMLLVRNAMPVVSEDRPLLIIQMFPIILSALFGGLGPGFLSTAIAGIGTAYFLIPPQNSFLFAASLDLFQWGMLIANGIIVSILSEAMHRSLRRTKALSQHINAVVSGTSDAVFVKDLKGRYLLFNESAARFVGRPAGEVIGHDDTFIFEPGAAERLMALDRSIMEGCRTQTHEEALTTMDGNQLTFLVTKGPVFDRQGKVTGLFGISRDITQWKKTAEMMRENETRYCALEERFRFIFEGAVDGIIVADAVTKQFIMANPAISRMLGYSPEEITLLGVQDIHPKSDLPYVAEQFEKQLKGETQLAADIPVLRKDGSIFLADIMSSAVTIEDRQCLMGVFRDMTEQKKAEKDKSKYRRQLELLLETAGEGIFGVDIDGNIIFVNKAAAGLMGFSRDELIGRSSHEVFHSHRADGAVYPWQECPLCKTLHDGTTRSGEETYFRAGGKGFPIEFTCTAMREGKDVTGAVMILHDISERRKIENELRQAQKLEGIGQLAGGIAHDFNNVLNAVIGFASLLQMKMDKSDPLIHYTDEIMAAGQRGAGLTQQILAFSRKQVLDMKPVNLNDMILGLQKMLQRLVREDIDIQYHLAGEALVIFADASQFDQVLINLITNARDAMPGGGRLSISTESSFMDAGYVEMHGYGSPGDYAVLTVADSGSGMTEETRSHIFDPFFTTKESGKGTGLGLSVVHGIIKQHNGYINVYSEIGKGTIFKIYLPLTEHVIETGEIQAAEQVRGGTETILIAEDDASLRKLSIALLNYYGYRVIEAVDGEDAVRKFTQHRDDISLVILDGIMPKMNGKEAYDEMRRLCPGMKAIFMSGYAEDIFARDGISEKIAIFIQKPVMPNKLLRKVRETLDS